MEENEAAMAKLEQLQYFQCHLYKRVIVVWHMKNLLMEKVKKLETWLGDFEKHVNYI